MSAFGQIAAEGIDEGAFAGAGGTSDADADRVARVRQQLSEERLCRFRMLGRGAFDQCDGAGEGGAVAR